MEAPSSPLRPVTILETVLRSHALTTLLFLIAFSAISWAWIIDMVRDMYGPMNGASAWMMTSSWDASHVFRSGSTRPVDDIVALGGGHVYRQAA